MSVPRNIFSSDTPMTCYRDDLFKSDETVMANADLKSQIGCKSKRWNIMPRVFHFGDVSGDCRRMPTTEGSKISNSARGANVERKDICMNDSNANRCDRLNRRERTFSFYNLMESAENDRPFMPTVFNPSMNSNAAKNKSTQFELGEEATNSYAEKTRDITKNCERSKCCSACKIGDSSLGDEPNTKSSSDDSFEFNYIILAGLVFGILLSKATKYLCQYLNWMLEQVISLRNAVFGRYALVDLLNMDNNSGLAVRHKIFLFPLVGFSCIVYVLFDLLNRFLQLLLNRSAQKLSGFVTKWH